ncbi:MAG: hypothetical protein ACFFCW_35990, partial [Candidatus Hodarchaeota archaeon]
RVRVHNYLPANHAIPLIPPFLKKCLTSGCNYMKRESLNFFLYIKIDKGTPSRFNGMPFFWVRNR